jgi:tryptophan-rich sensory protein
MLSKPEFTPPGWVFGPVWTLLYTMMGIALFLVWSRHKGGKKRTRWLVLFFIHLALNALWSVLFFGYHLLFIAFVEICILWITLVALILLAFRFDRRVGFLLLPYLAWVSFATYLTYTLFQLNP